MRELMLGIVVVGLAGGLVMGRTTERARRAYRDWGAAKTARKKGKTTAMGEIRRAMITGIVIAAVVVGVLTYVFTGGT